MNIDIEELTKDYKEGDFRRLSVITGINRYLLQNYSKGDSLRTSTAFKILKAIGQPLPCDHEKVNAYMRQLWDKSEHSSVVKVGEDLGLSENTIARWIYIKKESDPVYHLFLMFCKHMGTDKNIFNYTFRGM